MNGAQLHLALNHLPVILSLIASLISAWGWMARSTEVKKVGLALTILSAGCAGIAFLTGEPAEAVLKAFGSLPAEIVHVHEEAGEAALIVAIVAGAAALGAFFSIKKNPKMFSYLFAVSVVVSAMSSLAFVRTAHLGGMIRHEEIRDR